MMNSIFYTLITILLLLFPSYVLTTGAGKAGTALAIASSCDALWLLWWYRREL